jgi:hypothetical protein
LNNSLYITATAKVKNLDNKLDIARWQSITDLIGSGVSLVDRLDYIKMPYRFKTYEPFAMPTSLENFSYSYEDCCLEKANELVELSNRTGKSLVVFYSGGIDSTTVLISFMKLLGRDELKNKITVALTNASINENPRFYYDHIRSKCNIASSEDMRSFFKNDIITVGGEHNDQLFGSDILLKMYYFMPEDQFHQPYSREIVVGWMSKNMDIDHANFWYDLLDHHIKTVAPCEVTTNYHFFWWYNFCFKWQNVYFRMLKLLSQDEQQLITNEFLKVNYNQFFNSISFQKWSMLNHDKKIGNSWRSYKLEAKKFILDYNKDQDFFDKKIKIGSLVNLFALRKISSAAAITSDLKFVSRDELDLDLYYDENNNFK